MIHEGYLIIVRGKDARDSADLPGSDLPGSDHDDILRAGPSVSYWRGLTRL